MEDHKLQIGYFADGPWAHHAFDIIIQDMSLVIDFLCVRYDKKDSILMKMAEEHSIDVLYAPNINSDDFLSKLRKYSSELYVSMSFDQIFKENIRKIPNRSVINCHAGKLPYYRGRNILNWVLINDEKEFGITVHYVDAGIDTGDIILQDTYPITDCDTYKTLLEKAYEACPDILYRAIKLIQKDRVQVIKQDDINPVGLYCGKRKENDEIIEWDQCSREVFNFIRAVTNPGPCATSFIAGKRIKIISAEMIPNAPIYKGIPGQVLAKDGDSFLIKTKDSYIRITKYDGKIKVGDRLERC